MVEESMRDGHVTKLSAATRNLQAADATQAMKNSGGSGEQNEAITSSCGDSEGYVGPVACPSQLSDLLHSLSNALTAVLVNAQVLEWKLPAYSHLKRPVREIERSAQRAGELLKRLTRRLAVVGATGDSPAAAAADSHGTELAAPPADNRLISALMRGGSDDLTSNCDARTSSFFPKRDDGSER